jgi:hypothetical protein
VKLNGITKFTAPLDDTKILVLWDETPGVSPGGPKKAAYTAARRKPAK